MGAGTFERFETKYLLNKEQKEAVYEAMKPYMRDDKFGNSTIRNIYFDRPDFRLIRDSLEKPVYKEKLRLRSYKQVADGDKVFIELKKKLKKIVYKRRIEASEADAMNYLCKRKELKEQSQISKEIDYFLDFYGDIKPKVFLSYDRCAYYDKYDSDFRMTFDSNILWREQDLSLTAGIYGKPLLDDSEALLEIKSAGAVPLWLTKVLSENRVYKVSFSKYGMAFNNIISENRRLFNRKLLVGNEEEVRERMVYGYV